MNFIEGIDQSMLGIFNNYPLEENQNLLSFSVDESEIPKFKDEKTTVPKNLFITKKPIKEKIKHQKLLLEKRGLTEKERKEIYFDKKEDLKRRNRESAQKSRDKKKLEFMQIIAENKKLKDEIYNINKKINLLCSGCKNIFDMKNDNVCINCTNTNSNNIEDESILNSPSTTTFFSHLKIQKIFNFVLISLFTLLCIFGLICNIPHDSIIEKNANYKQIRNLEDNINLSSNNYSKNNISKFDDYFLKKHQHQINSTNNSKNNNLEERTQINNYKNEICEKDFFTSFQCKKTPFPQKISINNESFEENHRGNNYYIENNDNTYFNSNNNNNKNLYFKLFVQSCSKDEIDENHNNSINDYTHYIFSSDNNMCQDFYFFCQRTE